MTSGSCVTINGAALLQNFGQIIGTGPASVTVGAPGATVQNIGTIRNFLSGGAAISYAALAAPSANLNLLNTGVIEAAGAGGSVLVSSNGGVVVTNTGTMLVAGGSGIRIFDLSGGSLGNRIVNTGTISAGTNSTGTAIELRNNDADEIVNSGTIIGTIDMGGGNDVLTNGGRISSSLIDMGAGDDLFTAGGEIERLEIGPTVVASLGDGNDTLDARGMQGRAVVFGGAGDDLYRLGFDPPAGLVLAESSGEGRDTVESLADFVLPDAIEDLALLNTAVRGQGNGESNRLTGNAEANLLIGMAGNDTILGGSENDDLRGGRRQRRVAGRRRSRQPDRRRGGRCAERWRRDRHRQLCRRHGRPARRPAGHLHQTPAMRRATATSGSRSWQAPASMTRCLATAPRT